MTLRCTADALLGSRAVLTDMAGRVMTEFVLEREASLSVRPLAPGVYVLKLADGSTIRIVRK